MGFWLSQLVLAVMAMAIGFLVGRPWAALIGPTLLIGYFVILLLGVDPGEGRRAYSAAVGAGWFALAVAVSALSARVGVAAARRRRQ